MIDRRQLVIGGLAGLLTPALSHAQPNNRPAGGNGAQAAGGGNANAAGGAQNLPGGQSGELGSRLGGQRQGNTQQQQMPNPYRRGGIRVPKVDFLAALMPGDNLVEIDL